MRSAPKGPHDPSPLSSRGPQRSTGAPTTKFRQRGWWFLGIAILLAGALALYARHEPATERAAPVDARSVLTGSSFQGVAPPPDPQSASSDSAPRAEQSTVVDRNLPTAISVDSTAGPQRISVPRAGDPGGAPLPEKKWDAGPQVKFDPPSELRAVKMPVTAPTSPVSERTSAPATSEPSVGPERR